MAKAKAKIVPKKKVVQQAEGDPLDIPAFLDRRKWTEKEKVANAQRSAKVESLPLDKSKPQEQQNIKEREDLVKLVDAFMRKQSQIEQEVIARQVLPIFNDKTSSIAELRALVEDRLPALRKSNDSEEGEHRLRGKARENIAQEIADALGDELDVSIHELRKALPDMDVKTLRSGLRRAVALKIVSQRKQGGRFVFTGAKARQVARQTAPQSSERIAPKVERIVQQQETTTMKKTTTKRASKSTATNSHNYVGERLSDGWRKALAELGKHADGLSVVEFKKIAEKHGVKPWFKRYVNGGILARPERGHVKLTAAGKKLVTA